MFIMSVKQMTISSLSSSLLPRGHQADKLDNVLPYFTVPGYLFYPTKIQLKLFDVVSEHVTPACVGNISGSSTASFGWVKVIDSEGWMIWRVVQQVAKQV